MAVRELAQARLSASEIIRILALVFPGRIGRFRVRRNGAKQWWMVIVIDGKECTVVCAAYIMSKGLHSGADEWCACNECVSAMTMGGTTLPCTTHGTTHGTPGHHMVPYVDSEGETAGHARCFTDTTVLKCPGVYMLTSCESSCSRRCRCTRVDADATPPSPVGWRGDRFATRFLDQPAASS